MLFSLLKYRQYADRHPAELDANVVSSNVYANRRRQLPIVDLDFPHEYVPSTNEGHAHLYLNVEIPYWRWVILNWGLYMGGVIEKGYFIWSLRRGGNFVRRRHIKKTTDEEKVMYTYGFLFKNKKKHD